MSPTKSHQTDHNVGKACVCKGVRRCLLCDTRLNTTCAIKPQSTPKLFIYCDQCSDQAFVEPFADHALHQAVHRTDISVSISGVYLKQLRSVISVDEELELVRRIDAIGWTDSQSGRRKQDFGPKVNFKRQKLRCDRFCGLPQFDAQLFRRIRSAITDQSSSTGCLSDFIAAEVCHLEYTPERGSHIEPHFDDFWLWGHRLVTVNLLSDTVLTLSLPKSDSECDCDFEIRVPLPSPSIVVLAGEARYKYHHSIKSADISGRRVAITYRELSPQFLPKGLYYESVGKEILRRADNEIAF